MQKSLISVVFIVIAIFILVMAYRVFNGAGGSAEIGSIKIKVQSRLTEDKNIDLPRERSRDKIITTKKIKSTDNDSIGDEIINLATEKRSTKITIKPKNSVNIKLKTYLIDENLSTTIKFNASKLKMFSYNLKFIKPIIVSEIGFYQPSKIDPGEYLRTVEIRAKLLNQEWTNYTKYTLDEDSGESRLVLNFKSPISELDVNPLEIMNKRGGFASLGDVAVYGTEDKN